MIFIKKIQFEIALNLSNFLNFNIKKIMVKKCQNLHFKNNYPNQFFM